MSWFANRKLRSVTDRAVERFKRELDDDAKSKTLALAIGIACHPTASYGDGGRMDDMLRTIRRVATTPCDPGTAITLLKQWESGSLTGSEVIERVWGMEINDFINRVVKRIKAA